MSEQKAARLALRAPRDQREAAMRHTVIGLFNTYAEADGARRTLVEAGFAYNEVELRANPETASDAVADESPGVLANIERFFSNLFSTSGPAEPAAARYADAIRRGAVLLAVDVANQTRAELAHNTLTQLGALEVNERVREPRPADAPDAQTRREHSMLDELGIGGPAVVPTAAQPPREPLRAAEEERRWERVDAPPHDTPIDDDPARTAIAAGGAPGSGAVLRPDRAPDDFTSPDLAPDIPPDVSTHMPRSAHDPVDYPSTTVRGAAQYQSDPSDLGRAAGLPESTQTQQQHGQWPGQQQGQWPGQSQRQGMMSGDDAAGTAGTASRAPAGRDPSTDAWPGRASMGDGRVHAAREDKPYPPASGTPSTISQRTAPAGAGRDAGGTSASTDRAAHMPDEHQPPQAFATDGDDTLRPTDARTAGSNPAYTGGTGAGVREPAKREPQQQPLDYATPDYAPNVGKAAQEPAAGTAAGMMNESEARRALDTTAGRSADPASGNAVGGRGAGASTAAAMPGADPNRMRDVPTPSDRLSAADAAAASRSDDSISGARGQQIPDEFLEYEEDFHAHYDEQFGKRTGSRYDEYVPAYRYGATMGRDTRYQDRPWDDDVELEAQHDWERNAPEGSWDRFKAAVRHGWERVTGHHHH
jgi:hypothetical protein